jgi:hypothetical protein
MTPAGSGLVVSSGTLSPMKWCVLVLFAACGGANAGLILEGSTGGSVEVTSSLDESPVEAPEDVDAHLHETPSYTADGDKLYVEVTSDDKHEALLIRSATAGMAATDFVVPVTDGGDIELHVEVASLETAPEGTSCRLKIFVLRMPQHDLLAIADGGGATTGRIPSEECLSATGTSIVRDKLPLLFRKQLEAKQ